MKKLQNNFTTPEQSKRLLELGVPAWTADLYFYEEGCISNDDEPSGVIPYDEVYQDESKEGVFSDYAEFPCWSVGRLIEIAKICSTSRYALRGLFLFFEECAADECMSQVMDYFEICNYQFDFSKLEELEE